MLRRKLIILLTGVLTQQRCVTCVSYLSLRWSWTWSYVKITALMCHSHKTSLITSCLPSVPHKHKKTTSGTIPYCVIAESTLCQCPESTKLCFYSVYLRTCATELQNRSFSNPASTSPPRRHPLHNRPHYHQQPSIWPCVSAPHFSVCLRTCCLCCDFAVQGIVGKHILQVACCGG